jgi:hypothetical protein
VPPRSLLDAQHLARQTAIQDGVKRTLGILLGAMPDLGEPALADYVDGAYPVVAGGQHAAGDTAAGYIRVIAAARARARGRRLVPRRPTDVEAALLKAGVLVEPDSRSLVAPVLRARALVDEGELVPAAMQAAASYAGALSSNDLQAAQRVGLDEGAKSSGLEVHGWVKSLGPGACSWCSTIADNVYDDADSIPWHDGDRCGVEPSLDDAGEDYSFDDSDIPF